MTDSERAALIVECLRREALGLQIPIVLPPRRSRPSGRRVRVAPGLMGDLACETEDGRLVVYVDPRRLRLLLAPST